MIFFIINYSPHGREIQTNQTDTQQNIAQKQRTDIPNQNTKCFQAHQQTSPRAPLEDAAAY